MRGVAPVTSWLLRIGKTHGSKGATARAATLILAWCALGLAWGVTSALASTPAPSSPSDIILRVGWTTDPATLNPFVGQEGSSRELYALNYDFLTGFNASTMATEPRLATAWSHTPDGKVWTFSLRKGVTWQDGRPFTARDVVFTYHYVIRNHMGAFTGYTTFIKRVVAVDRYTVRFVCSRPKANMLALLVPILPEHVWAKVDPKAAGSTYPNKPPVVGTGPFQVVEYRENRYVRLVANKDYWRGAPKVDGIVFQIYQNVDSMRQDLQAGVIQEARDLPLAALQELENDANLEVSTFNANRLVHDLGFNCYPGHASKGNAVLRDPAFRRALNYAVNKQEICRVVYLGAAKPAETVLLSDYWKDPDWHWTPPADERYTFDLDKARAALDAAGYRDTDGDGVREVHGKPIVLRLWAIADEIDRQAVGKLLVTWFRQIGLKIHYEVLDEGALMDRMWNYEGKTFAPDYDMFLWGWDSEVDPNFALSVFTTSQMGSWSDTNWSNKEYDRLYEEQQAAVDPARRKRIIDRMQQLMYRETPMIFFAEPPNVNAWNVSTWEGWVRSPGGDGATMGTYPVVDSYLFAHPRAGAGAGGQSGGLSGGVIVAGAVVAGIVVVLLTRRVRLRPREDVES
jgi:peptide/nickel transport system substrate-binding protein